MYQVEQLAQYVAEATFEDLRPMSLQQLKIRVLDSLGCAIGALEAPPIRALRQHLQEFGGEPISALIGGGETAPDRAALYNSALVRYLDYNDSYLAPGETCHPSDNLGAVMAAGGYAGATGAEMLTALAVAYRVQCRLSDEAPVRAEGFDHTTQGSYAAAAGVAKALKLNPERIANAIAISGTAFNALRVTRTGRLSNWKGLAYPNTAFCATHAAFLAMRGISGPLGVFEGKKGFIDSIAGPFEIDWSGEALDRVNRTIIKKHNAEIHSQSALECLTELMVEHQVEAQEIERMQVDIFDVAYHIIGGGEEGSKKIVETKEEADHSLPYMMAVMALDGQLGPEQYHQERILGADVQSLLQRVDVQQKEGFSHRFPEEMPCSVTLFLKDGRRIERGKRDYEGFFTRPMPWERVVEKFERLSSPFTSPEIRRDLIAVVDQLESVPLEELTRLLADIQG
jgi:2-methylcitrate dehydratase